LQKKCQLRPPGRKGRAVRGGAGIWLGRFLFILSAISLLTAPLTQHLWTWDHFLHGGQDFELATLMVLTSVAFVLVLSRQCRENVDLLLVPGRLPAGRSGTGGLRANAGHWRLSMLRPEPVSGPAGSIYRTPLQI
jgi:hypothetical protein